ncbi:UNVERIFIED_CONTAM: hypothetical protein FKN15_008993 [Acipenser sinensis]
MHKDSEPKPLFPKPLVPKPTTNLNQPEKEPKPLFPKPPSGSKPPWVTENSQNNDSNTKSIIPPKPPKKTSIQEKTGSTSEEKKDPSAPKRNTLPNIFALGSPPAKPNRPPNVNLEKFKKGAEFTSAVPNLGINKPVAPPPPPSHPGVQATPSLPSGTPLPSLPRVPNLGINKPVAPPPPPSHPGVQATPSLPSGTPLPSLPRGHPAAVVQPDPDETYDDVGMSNPPPLPAGKPGDGNTEHLLKLKADPRKQKKFEKEEKEFRKKFKYDGEIQVLHQVTVVPALANKKWGGKDLPLKPGEVLDLIQKAVDNKMICRNDEGKFGYVLNSNIIAE